METDLILALTLAGVTLGIVEGIKPGPLLTMVIKETLSGGLRAGALFAASCSGDVGSALIVKRDRYGIGNRGVSSPFRDHKLRLGAGILRRGWSSGDSWDMDRVNVSPVIFITTKNRNSEEACFSRGNLVGDDSTARLALKALCFFPFLPVQ